MVDVINDQFLMGPSMMMPIIPNRNLLVIIFPMASDSEMVLITQLNHPLSYPSINHHS